MAVVRALSPCTVSAPSASCSERSAEGGGGEWTDDEEGDDRPARKIACGAPTRYVRIIDISSLSLIVQELSTLLLMNEYHSVG